MLSSLNFFNTLFKLIEDLEIDTSMLFNLDFARNAVFSCFFFFFLTIDLCLLIPAVITQIFIPNVATVSTYPTVSTDSSSLNTFLY